MFFVILLGVGHKNFVVEIPDAERRVMIRKVRIDEAVGSHLMKILVVGFNVAAMEIRHKQKIVTIGDAERCAFINGVVRPHVVVMIDGDDGVCRVHHRVPAGDHPIFTGKNEPGWLRVSIFCHLEERRAVKDDPGGSPSVVMVFCRNGNDQRQRCAILLIECRDTGAVIADPNDAGRRGRHAPGIDKVWIGVLRDAGDVRL